MTTNTDLKKILRSGESETVEFKRSLSEKDQILETISAFSNTHGGTIYIGIEETGIISGAQIGKKTLETWTRTHELKINVANPSYNEIRIPAKPTFRPRL